MSFQARARRPTRTQKVTKGSGRPLDEVTAALRWAEGRRRYEVIEQLVQNHRGPLPADKVQDAASVLGVSLRTVYRLIKLYRMYGTVDALQPRPKGRPEGSRALSHRVETVIREIIETVLHEPTRPTLTYLVEQVHARCSAEGLPLPHRRTIRARYMEMRS
jgi:putative transposase